MPHALWEMLLSIACYFWSLLWYPLMLSVLENRELLYKDIVRVENELFNSAHKRKMCQIKNNKRVLSLKGGFETFSERHKENDLRR